MVFPFAQQPRDTYHLWRVFDYPTDHGPVAAIAVPSHWRESIVSIYSNMLGFIYVQIWVLIIATIIRLHKRKAKPEPVQRVAFHEQERFWVFYSWAIKRCVSIQNQRSFWHFGTWTKNHLKPFKSQYSVWLVALGFVWFSKIGVAPALIWALVLGEGAPVNGDSLFFPQPYNDSDVKWSQKYTNIFKPSILRALTVTQLGTPEAVNRVQLNETIIGQQPDGEQILKFDYAYNISGQDFGMQHFGDLSFVLQGSCVTEYDWLQPGVNDSYLLWGQNYTLSQQQLAIPRAFFVANTSTYNSPVTTNTYAAYVSTSGQDSITIGTDPWYLTTSSFDPETNALSYSVKNNRPLLSCTETNVWTWNGQEIGDSYYFGTEVPGFPFIYNGIFYSLLYYPPITSTANYLDTINLAVAEQDTETSFDAGAGSIYKDLNRLLVTSFVWNSNILFDLTLNNRSNTYGFPNYILESQNQTEVADFVVYTSDVAALALVFVMIVPTAMIFMIIANYKMGYGLEMDYQPKEDDGDEAQVTEEHQYADIKGSS